MDPKGSSDCGVLQWAEGGGGGGGGQETPSSENLEY